jgi:pimeloyl-ACP methyl ester carboxylesterase
MPVSQHSGRHGDVPSKLAIAAVLAMFIPCVAYSEYVFLRDGTVLRGRVYREGQLHRDPASGNLVWLADTQGFYLVADGARRIAFSQKNVHLALPDSQPSSGQQGFRFPRQLNVFGFSPTLNRVPAFTEIGPWIASERPQVNGSRVLKGEFLPGLNQRVQYITSVTPEAIQAATTEMRWTASYRPDEFDRATLLSILRHHLRSRKPTPSAWEQGLSLFRYCLQTGWLEEAEAELANLRNLPEANTETLVELEQQLRQAQADRIAQRLEWAYAGGQYRAVEELLGHFPSAYASEKALRQARTIQVKLQERRQQLETTRRLLESVRQAAPHFLPEAVQEISAYLNLDTCSRLDAFRRLALQEERLRQQGKSPQLTAEQLLALAVSGWTVGDRLAEANLETAEQLWRDRQMVQQILLQDHPRERLALMEKLRNMRSQDLDLLVQMLRELPPPRVESNPPVQLTWLTTLDGQRQRYLVQVPLEYHPHRRYPVLLVLPDAGEDTRQAIEPWRKAAQERGYILVSVPWAGPVQSSYRWSAAEQVPVLAVLRDLRRRFAVDASRLFVFGMGEGGSLAFDLGMSHPDLFAGVVVMSGRPGPHQGTYWTNGQYLPFYVVEGELDGPKRDGSPPANEGPAQWRALFRNWVQAGFPSLYIEYDGRGREFFAGEIPDIFEWMRRKQRHATPPELGRPQILGAYGNRDFVGIRPEDDRFYWLSLPNAPGKHRLAAQAGQGNRIQIATSPNVRRLHVWLNSDLVDFNQPIRVHLVSAQKVWQVQVQPDLRVLLEDFYQRGDPEQLFVARLELEW